MRRKPGSFHSGNDIPRHPQHWCAGQPVVANRRRRCSTTCLGSGIPPRQRLSLLHLRHSRLPLVGPSGDQLITSSVNGYEVLQIHLGSFCVARIAICARLYSGAAPRSQGTLFRRHASCASWRTSWGWATHKTGSQHCAWSRVQSLTWRRATIPPTRAYRDMLCRWGPVTKAFPCR